MMAYYYRSLSQRGMRRDSDEKIESYDTNHRRIGRLFIFSNLEADPNSKHKDVRDANQIRRNNDIERIQRTFAKLDILAIKFTNLTIPEMKSVIIDVARADDPHSDCLIFFIFTEGSHLMNEDVVFDNDYNPISITELLKPFRHSSESCIGKPKFIFIQATSTERLARNSNGFEMMTPDIKFGPDFLIYKSSASGYWAWRKYPGESSEENDQFYREPGDASKEQGSVFIQSLCDEIEGIMDGSADLYSTLQEARQKVSDEFEARCTNDPKFDFTNLAPVLLSSLTKKFYFTPRSNSPNSPTARRQRHFAEKLDEQFQI